VRSTGGGGSGALAPLTKGAAFSEAERGMAEMSAKFAEVGNQLYVSESGEKREAID
jgi:phosphomethylpyrimidine synthase